MHVQSITERSAQVQSLITRTRVAQVVCLGVAKVVCHPSVTSHRLPHLSQNTSTRSLSLTSPPSCPTSAPSGLDQETLRDSRRSVRYIKSASHTGYESKLIQSDGFEARRIELDRNLVTDLHPRRIELDRSIGADPYQIPE